MNVTVAAGQSTGVRLAVHKLVLYPSHVESPAVDNETLVAALQTTGLIDAPVCQDPSTGYRAGERFLQLITFLGCAPAIELDPPTDPAECARACANGSLCHIRLLPEETHLRFRGDNRLPAPRCPRCRKNEPGWPVMIEHWRANPGQNRWVCRECGYRGRLYDLNFRKRGAFGQTFIDICGIHPAEAVPVETLLEALGELTGCGWLYMYLQE
jgi:hypothetical protein